MAKKTWDGLSEEFEVDKLDPQEIEQQDVDEPEMDMAPGQTLVERDDERGGEMQEHQEDPLPELSQEDKEFNSDVEDARKNLKSIMEHGEGALEEMRRISQVSEHPRAYEVMSTMMRSMVDANKALIDIAEKKRYPKPQDNQQGNSSKYTQNNTYVFQGNASDVLKALEENDSDNNKESSDK